MKSIFALALLSFFSLAAQAQPAHVCGADRQGTTAYRYCIDTPDNLSGEILWYFHQVFGNEQTWATHGEMREVRARWTEQGKAQPTVISISLGTFWLMTLENKVYPDFVSLILPILEERAGGLRGRRLLLGYSMGGFNASQLLFRDGRLFARAALLSPAFPGVGPFSSQSEVDDYFRRNKIGFVGRFKVNTFLNLLKGAFGTEEAWQAHDPLRLVQARGLPRGVPVYVSAGDADNYGFHEGAEAFVGAAQARGSAVQWESLSGGHRALDPEAIAKFLLP